MKTFTLEAPGDVRRHMDANQARLPDTNERRKSAVLHGPLIHAVSAKDGSEHGTDGSGGESLAATESRPAHLRARSRAFDRPKDIDHLLPSDWDMVTNAVAHAGSSRFQRVRLGVVPQKLKALLQAGRMRFRLREPIVFCKDPSTQVIHKIADDASLDRAKRAAAAFFISLGHVHRKLNGCLEVLRKGQPQRLVASRLRSSQLSLSGHDDREEMVMDREEEIKRDFFARRAALREVHAMVWLPPMRRRLINEVLPVLLANAAAFCTHSSEEIGLPRSWPRLNHDPLHDPRMRGGKLSRAGSQDLAARFSMAVRCFRVIAALLVATAGMHGKESASGASSGPGSDRYS